MREHEVRTATVDDIPSIIELQRKLEDEQAIWGYRSDSADDWRSRDLTWTIVADSPRGLVGFLHGVSRPPSGECVFPADARVVEIVELVVHKDQRGVGIGRDLVAALQDRARRHGITHLRLYSAAKRFSDIVAFYGKCGFTPWYLEMTQDLREPTT